MLKNFIGDNLAFKRHEGFTGSLPQKFIDRTLINCPICGGNNPHWSLDMKMTLDLEGNKYLFKCEQCGCILSARVPDVTGFNKTALTTTGLIKKMKGKRNSAIYMIIEDIGTQTNMKDHVGKEMALENLINLRYYGNNQTVQRNITYSSNNQTFKFCTNCGTKLKSTDKFCTKCGNKV